MIELRPITHTNHSGGRVCHEYEYIPKRDTGSERESERKIQDNKGELHSATKCKYNNLWVWDCISTHEPERSQES